MKSAILSMALIVLCRALCATPSAGAIEPPGCVTELNAKGCPDAGDIIVEVTQSGSKQSKDGGARAPGPPVGSTRYVDCGPGAVSQLRALPDPAAAHDAYAECASPSRDVCLGNLRPGLEPVEAIEVKKQRDGTWQYDGGACLTREPAVTAADVRARAVRLIPPAALGLAPHGTTLVNIETVMWVDAPTRQTLPAIAMLGHRVVITIAIDHVDYAFGDGTTDQQPDGGKPYDDTGDPCRSRQCADYYGHTFLHTGRLTVTATASWTATFTVDGGNPVTIPGTIAGPTARAALHVREARAVLVPDPGSR